MPWAGLRERVRLRSKHYSGRSIACVPCRRLMPADGFLVLGAAETVVGLTEAFKPLTDRRGLYMLNAAPPAPRLALAAAR